MFPDGNAIMTGSDDHSCRLFDLRSDCQVGVYADSHRLNSAVSTIEFSPSGRLLFASYEDGTLGTWDVLKGNWLGEISRNNGPGCQITSVQINSEGSRLFTSSWDSMASILDNFLCFDNFLTYQAIDSHISSSLICLIHYGFLFIFTLISFSQCLNPPSSFYIYCMTFI